MPRTPEQQTGRIYEISVNHGTVVYVTKDELARAEFVLDKMMVAQFFVFMAIGYLRIRYKDL